MILGNPESSGRETLRRKRVEGEAPMTKTTLLFTSSFGLQNLSVLWGGTCQASREVCACCAGLSEATSLLQEVMGIPTFLALPAARSDRAACTSCHPLDHMLLWTALLFLGEAGSPGGAVEQGQRQACFSNSAAVTSVGAEPGQG